MGRRTAQTTEAENRTNPVPRWVAPGFALAAVCTVPWVVFLAASLPATSRVNDRLAWVGFDVGEVVMLALTAYLAWRGKAKVALAATALATMLVVDAWFDVNTSTAGAERDMALGFAVLEVSLAAVSLWIAFHAASVARRRLEDLARREAEREIRRTLPSRGRPGRLTDLADWARERPVCSRTRSRGRATTPVWPVANARWQRPDRVWTPEPLAKSPAVAGRDWARDRLEQRRAGATRSCTPRATHGCRRANTSAGTFRTSAVRPGRRR